MKSRRKRVRETQDGEPVGVDVLDNDDAPRRLVSWSRMPDGELKAPPQDFAGPGTKSDPADLVPRRDSTRTSGTRRKETGFAFYVWIALACVVTTVAAGVYLLATR